jgi:hypothetical protein
LLARGGDRIEAARHGFGDLPLGRAYLAHGRKAQHVLPRASRLAPGRVVGRSARTVSPGSRPRRVRSSVFPGSARSGSPRAVRPSRDGPVDPH